MLNIPPRQFKHVRLGGSFGKEEADRLKTGRWQRIAFEAKRPKRPILGVLGNKAYRKTITEP